MKLSRFIADTSLCRQVVASLVARRRFDRSRRDASALQPRQQLQRAKRKSFLPSGLLEVALDAFSRSG